MSNVLKYAKIFTFEAIYSRFKPIIKDYNNTLSPAQGHD